MLLYNSTLENSRARAQKLNDSWFGPFHIWQVGSSGYYRLKELDGIRFAESFAGNRLIKFFSRNAADIGQGEVGANLEATREFEDADEEDAMEENEFEHD